MKGFFRFTVLILALLMLAACNSDPLEKLDIPDTGYEQCFSAVESAVLYVDGTEQQIAPDDPRLLRVLSFLGYAAETRQYIHTQGVLLEDEINQYYASGATMLEVTFAADAASNNEFRRSPKILICGDAYLLFMNAEEPCAEQHWPYYEQAPEGAKRSQPITEWGSDCWLDILEYCGF